MSTPPAADGIVLVHGGYHGSWCWDGVRPLLDGPAIAVDLPGRGPRPFAGRRVQLSDCVDAVLGEADRAGFERFVLVGHSMGGLTTTATAWAHPQRVAHAVYLAALCPPLGVCVDQLYGLPDDPGVDPASRRDVLPAEIARALFAQDLDDAAWDHAHQRCVPEPMGLFLATVPGYSSTVPATYVRATRDAAVSADAVRTFVDTLRPGAVVELDSDHDTMLSHPAETAAAINAVWRSLD